MSIGIWQLVLILAIILLIFGAGKLPKVMKDIGSGIKNLKDGLKQDEKSYIVLQLFWHHLYLYQHSMI